MNNIKRNILIGVGISIILIVLLGDFLRLDRFGLSMISWVDCVQINETKYIRSNDETPVDPSIIDKKIGTVQFNVARNVHNSNYRFRNCDATFLDVGTEIYSIKSKSDEIAVKIGTQYYLYKTVTEG